MDETGVLGLLEELSILLEDSKPVFGKNNLRQVDIAAAFDIMDEIRDLFPAEFSQARQIVRERQSLLDDAEVEANRMIEDARSQAITIASEQEIVRISQQQADTILADARRRGVRAHRAEPRHAAEQHAPLPRSPERRPLGCVAPVSKQVTKARRLWRVFFFGSKCHFDLEMACDDATSWSKWHDLSQKGPFS